MTDKEIIKALECHIDENSGCEDCPYISSDEECVYTLIAVALDLVKRQQAEIANLEIELKAMRGAANSYKMHYENAKTEQISALVAHIDQNILRQVATIGSLPTIL